MTNELKRMNTKCDELNTELKNQSDKMENVNDVIREKDDKISEVCFITLFFFLVKYCFAG